MAALDLTELAPNDGAELRRLAVALHEAGQLADAVKIYRQVIAIDPSDVAILNNLSACLCNLGKFDEAAAACERAIALAPQDALLWSNHAALLLHKGEIDAALAVSHRAVALAPQHPTVRFNHSHLLLLCGDFQNGFSDYRWRRQCAGLFSSRMNFKAPEWRGEPFAGRTLLLFAEQGIGDALQFIRYLPMVAARGGEILLSVQDTLAPLLRQLEGITVVARSAPLPPFDLQLSLMDLPHVFGTRLDSIPAEIPYLHADPDKVASWRRALGDVDALKVGIAWAGSAIHKGDRYRSLPAEAVLPLLVMPGVQLYSLQKEPRAADVTVLAALGSHVIDLAPALGDFTDTAAAVAALDLVISVDTSVVHLTGAMGRPAWVLLPYAQDWRWLRERDDSPWYPTLRLFRQEKPQAWNGVLTRVAAELAELARTR
jgi:tetratricopeptide (TPR) repeat protein